MADRGRPRFAESAQRRKQFISLVLSGSGLKDAATTSQIQPLRALAILDELGVVGAVEINRQKAA